MRRLIYEEKRLYIHEVGGETLTTTIRNCHRNHIATSVDTVDMLCIGAWNLLQEIRHNHDRSPNTLIMTHRTSSINSRIPNPDFGLSGNRSNHVAC